MPLRPGTRFSHYEVLAPLGAGGMGEVFRARDTKLGRDVAIKTLPEVFMADPERLARFEREARVLASLNHPHIGAIYGVEEVDGVRGLVLELIEGDTLAERLATSQVPVAEALALARQVAEALDAAHDRGIIHRDLKPANIKLTPAGTVKVLDFGLAKAIAGADADVDLSASPTVTGHGTREGVILGTAAYMSPEQARGRPLDKRTDIWSFGCVLYELLTGRRAFKGDNLSDTIGAILRDPPEWRALPSDTPALVRRLLRRCLEKDPARRLRDIGDASLEIAEALATPALETADAAGQAAAAPRVMGWARWTAGVVLAAVVTGVAVWWVVRPAVTTPTNVLRLSMLVPAFETNSSGIAVSRDGTKLVYKGDSEEGSAGARALLFLRALDAGDPQPISGTEGATQPFFSPDGEWIGFFVTKTILGSPAREAQLKKVATRGGPPVVLADAVALGGSWGSDNAIAFSRATATGVGLFKVSASGGTPEPLTTPQAEKGERHAWPDHLPGGKAIIFSITDQPTFNEGRIAVLSLETGRHHTVVEQGYHARFLTSGHLAYLLNGHLMTVLFDGARLEATGPPIRSEEAVQSQSVSGDAGFGVSVDGLLAYAMDNDAPGRRSLSWVTREGIRTPLSFEPDDYAYPRLSPDGRRLAIGIASDIWVIDLDRATRTRITSRDRGLQPPPAYMTWTPDGRHLTFNRRIKAPETTIEWIDPSGSEKSTVLVRKPHFVAGGAWSPDGRVLAFFEALPATQRDLSVLEPGGDRQSRPFLVTPANERGPRFSPNGRWIAYVSDTSGRDEVFMNAFPGPSGAIPVSIGGGREPVWSRDGRELFYRQGDRLMTVAIDDVANPSLRSPRLLFEGPYQTDPQVGLPNYDVAPDGRFLMVSDPRGLPITRFTIVQNWFEELKRRVPPGRP